MQGLMPKQKAWLARNARLMRVVSTLGLVLVVWQIFGSAGAIDPFQFSWPTRIGESLADMASAGDLWTNLAVSGLELIAGLAISLLAIPLGLLIGHVRTLEVALDPYITALYATPMVAVMPLLVIWLGLGMNSKVAVIAILTFFPILISTVEGVKNANPSLIRAARSFGVTGLRLFVTVLLPSAIPYIVAGIRVGIGRGVTGLVVGEMLAATAGIGFQIRMSAEMFRTSDYLAGVVVLIILSACLMEILRWLEHRLTPWQGDRRV